MAIKKAQQGVVVSKKDEKANPNDFKYLRKSEKSASQKAIKSKIKPKEMIKKAKSGTSVKKAQAGANMLLPGVYAPKSRDEKYNTSPSIKAKPKPKPKTPIQEATPEEVKKYGMRGSYAAKNGKTMKKAKSGGSFPDLNKDGKVTKADILKGRGVIAKSGSKMKTCKGGC